MFSPADLALRQAAAPLPSRAGYRLTRQLTPVLGGRKRAWIGAMVERKVIDILGDEELARRARDRFATEIACDDLDALTSVRWPEARRLESTELVGEQNLTKAGPTILTSFHLSGGFRIFDVLRSHGLRPVFIHVPPREAPSVYERVVWGARSRYCAQNLVPPFVAPGPGARDRLDAHLGSGGAVVALLDVEPSSAGLRDSAEATLFGRPLRLPLGLLRLAARHQAPVTTYLGRIEEDRRIIELRPSVTSNDPEHLLRHVLTDCETEIRRRPWTWQSWLHVEHLFARE